MGNCENRTAETAASQSHPTQKTTPSSSQSSPEYREAQTARILSKFPPRSSGAQSLPMIYESDEISSMAAPKARERNNDSDGTGDTDEERAVLDYPRRHKKRKDDGMCVERSGALTPSELKFLLREFRAQSK